MSTEAGKSSSFKIYNDEFFGGMFESVAQNVNGFNAASANAIRLVAADLKGNYNKESFMKTISSLITRRDITSVSSADDIPMTQGELVGVKINRKIGPIAQTLDAWRKISSDQREMSFILGQMIGQEKAKDYLNTAIMCAEAALEGQNTNCYDATGASTATMTATHLNSGMAKLGDAAGQLACWVMHSKPYFDLVGQAISDKIYEEAGVVVYGGTPGTFGRPVVVADAPALYTAATSASGSYANYHTLGLMLDGAVIKESEQEEVVSEVVTGLENLVFRVQGEYAFNAEVKGVAWDVTNGGANPTDAALGTSSNWDKVATSYKHLAGVRITTK